MNRMKHLLCFLLVATLGSLSFKANAYTERNMLQKAADEATLKNVLVMKQAWAVSYTHLDVYKRQNQYSRSAYFIEKGMTRSYWLVNGEEITTSFSCEGGIVFSMDELYYNKMSEEFVETLEDVVAYKIALSDLIRLFQTNIELANWGRIIHQNEYRRLHRSHKDRLTLSAKERYEEFMQQFPQICQRVQLGYIASYLGITLPTLSRLRSRK